MHWKNTCIYCTVFIPTDSIKPTKSKISFLRVIWWQETMNERESTGYPCSSGFSALFTQHPACPCQVEVQEKYVDVPTTLYQEKVVEVPRVQVAEVVKQVPKIDPGWTFECFWGCPPYRNTTISYFHIFFSWENDEEPWDLAAPLFSE